jgi:peptidyl-dipeptidase Dcp
MTDHSPTSQNTSSNPLLQLSTNPFGAVPFDRIEKSHFKPALVAGIALAKSAFSKMSDDPSPATFENTILEIETVPEQVHFVSSIFHNLVGTNSDPEMQALNKELSPLMADFASDLLLDSGLFKRVKSVWDRREALGLKGEELRLTEKLYKSFLRNGALLNDADKLRLREIDQKLSTLGPEFGDNVLKATNDFKLVIEDKSDLEGLPAQAIESYKEAADECGLKGKWLVTLHAPSYVPFMTYSPKRRLREKLWKAYNGRAIRENPAVLVEIAKYRHMRANLLGYKTHAHFVLEERMAATPEKVQAFLDRLMEKVAPAARRDLSDVRKFKKETSGDENLEPWDYAFWAEKLKLKQHDFDEEVLRPYFQLEKVIDGVFEHARKLFGLVFRPIAGLPTHHPDVRTYEVIEEKTSRHIGLFYADFFPRASKRSGAWMTSFREQGFYKWNLNPKGAVERPHIAIVCNFTKPTANAPSLLTLDEVKTLFHEFGHALHGLLSDCKYVSLAGTNVYWDFVELPSQIMENWVNEQEALALFAKHYQTHELIPLELVTKIRKSAQFQAGYFSLRQLGFGAIDLAWHAGDPSGVEDVISFERKAMSKTSLFPPVDGTSVSTAFSHIFEGGYSAGYYSYKWAEVLDADAFEFFKEKGIFNSEVANSFRENILSRGGSEDPMVLYKKFRGREPDPDALLRREGLI